MGGITTGEIEYRVGEGTVQKYINLEFRVTVVVSRMEKNKNW